MSAYAPSKITGPRYKTSYRPSLSLGNGCTSDDTMGLSILAALSVAGIHASICPSIFTFLSFATKPEAKQRAMTSLWIGLGASTIGSLGIWMVFEKFIPAAVAEATALLLFGAGVWAINQKPADTIPPIEQQQT